ncbi:hypothetical protein CEXT_253941 [Caerostris extrusa]|uniref:Uncharacterized protein n=1 Tax=Caerostris extrusa TaxID=172846 RepID=A0AAV4XAY4_CAEEX|nr:hypothetical protein CEXT_253941 [Caerostris extrusa]
MQIMLRVFPVFDIKIQIDSFREVLVVGKKNAQVLIKLALNLEDIGVPSLWTHSHCGLPPYQRMVLFKMQIMLRVFPAFDIKIQIDTFRGGFGGREKNAQVLDKAGFKFGRYWCPVLMDHVVQQKEEE